MITYAYFSNLPRLVYLNPPPQTKAGGEND